MPHPERDIDPDLLERVREIALALPGTHERRSVGIPTFGTTKLFCWVSGSERGTRVQHPRSVLVFLDGDAREALLQRGAYVPAYLGPYGWIGLDVDDHDWDELAELIEESYRATAPARLVRALDDR